MAGAHRARRIADRLQRHAQQRLSAESDAIIKRELAKVSYPADGKLLGDWKKGYAVANNGRGGQFSDPPGTVAGGNCFACHQLDPMEVSYGTLGPSLAAYGKDRKYDAEAMKDAYTKIYNSMAVVPCSNMPRFGSTRSSTSSRSRTSWPICSIRNRR